MTRFGFLISAGLLAGCQYGGVGMPGSPAWHATATVNDQARYFRERCTAYGFRPNTVEMAQCIQSEAGSSRQAASVRAAAIGQAMAAASQPRSPVHTTCNRFGSRVSCTSY